MTNTDPKPAQDRDFARLPIHIANYLLTLAEQENVCNVTPMKLLKLVYFSYAWYLELVGKKLFDEQVEAWKFGPVVPSIYHEFKHFGNQHITDYAAYYDTADSNEPQYLTIDGKDRYAWGIVWAVWQHYKHHHGAALSAITHQPESPWTEAFVSGRNAPLGPEKIRQRARQAINEYLNNVKAAA